MLGGSGLGGGGAPGAGGGTPFRERDSRESTRQARAPHTTSQRGFFPHEAGQITVGAAWWLCGCAVCNVAARFLDPLLRRWGGPTGQVESIAARCRRPRP